MRSAEIGVEQCDVPLGHLERVRAVTEQPGERQQVAAEEQVAGREGMPECMGRAADTADPGARTEAPDALVDGGRAQWPTVVIEEDRATRRPAPVVEIAAEREERGRTDRNEALLTALANDPGAAHLKIDPFERQACELAQAEAGVEQDPEDGRPAVGPEAVAFGDAKKRIELAVAKHREEATILPRYLK